MRLADPDVVVIDGCRVTACARTCIDVAALLRGIEVADLVADALRRELVSPAAVQEAAARRGRAAGKVAVVGALDLLAGVELTRAESPLEVEAVTRLLAAGLPRPELNHQVFDDEGHPLARVDLAYPEHKLAIEIDGLRWHGTPGQRRSDDARQNRLAEAGWLVLRFTAADLRRAGGRAFVASVRRALEPH